MQNNYQNKKPIKCPTNTILIWFIIKCWGTIGIMRFSDFITFLLNTIFFIADTLSVFWAYKGMNQQIFYLYKRALLISLILSIVSLIIRIITIIFISKYDANSKAEKYAKNILLIGTIIGIFYDWLLTVILFLFRKRIENYCENDNNTPKLTTGNTVNAPLA